MKFLKQATYIRYVLANLSKFVKIVCRPPWIIFYGGSFENRKGPRSGFQVTFFIEFLDLKFCFVILHELAKFHNQTVFTS